MPFAKLVIIQPGRASRMLLPDGEFVTFGRALDNVVALEDDANVSRYHAEIEARGDTFCLLDLNSRNGTTVNDVPVEGERQLVDGDLICLGGSTIIEFHVRDTPWETPEATAQQLNSEHVQVDTPQVASINVVDAASAVSSSAGPGVASEAPAAAVASTGLSPMYIVGGILGGLLLTGSVGGILWFSSSRGCDATVTITNPQTGTTVKGPIPIRVEAEKTDCIDRLIYQLDGVKVASSEISPYEATLDPADITGLTPGNHVLTVTVEDHEGNREVQPDEIVLGFEMQTTTENGETTTSNPTDPGNDGPGSTQRRTLSSAEIKEMCEKLLRQLSKREYILTRDLIHQIEKRTTEYATAGFYNRARPFRDAINDSFVNEQGLEKPLGFILAMSRSKFSLSSDRSSDTPQGDGLWRFPATLAENAGYIGRCGTSTLSDQDQKCAAIVAAAYMKALEVDLFGGDVLFAVACFGMHPNDVARWRDQLPADRRDLWNVIKSSEQRDLVTRFLAAGIVGENPQRFSLNTETPLSNLYPK